MTLTFLPPCQRERPLPAYKIKRCLGTQPVYLDVLTGVLAVNVRSTTREAPKGPS